MSQSKKPSIQVLAKADGAEKIGYKGGSVATALLARLIAVETRTAMKAFDVGAGVQFHLTEAGREGVFEVKTGTPPADTLEGVYVVLNNGNYAERVDTNNIVPEHFGAVADGVADDTAPVQAWIDFLISENRTLQYVNGHYLVKNIDVDGADKLTVAGGTWRKKFVNDGVLQNIFTVRNSNAFLVALGSYYGTSSESTTFEITERHGGLDIRNSSFCGALNCEFAEFSSHAIFAQYVNGGTYSEGLFIDSNVFRDFPYDAGSTFQTAILLSLDAEYSTITNNRFFRIPSAVRFYDGANCLFAHNVVMDLNSVNNIDVAALFQEQRTNSGKLQIVNNKFNHIETGQYIIFIKGDPTKPQNEVIIENNEIIVSGAELISNRFIILNDSPGAKIIGNNLRSLHAVNNQGLIRLSASPGCVIDQNSFRGGDYAIELDDSSTDTNIGVQNSYAEQGTGKLLLLAGSTLKVADHRGRVFGLDATGAVTFGDTDGLTITNPITGRFTVTHNFGDDRYFVGIENDNQTPAVERRYSVERSANSFNINITDSAGNPIDESVIVNVTLAKANTFLE